MPVDQAWGLMRQLPDARLLVAPDCGHELMVRRPALFNEACAGFYRSTESIARRRATAFLAGSRASSPAPAIGRGSGPRSSALEAVEPDPPERGSTDVAWLAEVPPHTDPDEAMPPGSTAT